MALAEVFFDRNDITEAAYHRAMAHAVHHTLRDLDFGTGMFYSFSIEMTKRSNPRIRMYRTMRSDMVNYTFLKQSRDTQFLLT